MRSRWRDQRGVTLVELLAAMALGMLVLGVVAGLQYYMGRAWQQDTGRAARQRTLQTALTSITDAVQSGKELSVAEGRLVVDRPGKGRIAFYLQGTDLKAERGERVITLAGGVTRFDLTATETGLTIRLTAGQGSQAERVETRVDLPPWHKDWGSSE